MENIDRNRPGGPLETFQLFDVKVLQSEPSKQLGVTTPEGRHYRFQQGEQFIGVQGLDGKRVPIIRTSNGVEQPFEKWAVEQDK